MALSSGACSHALSPHARTHGEPSSSSFHCAPPSLRPAASQAPCTSADFALQRLRLSIPPQSSSLSPCILRRDSFGVARSYRWSDEDAVRISDMGGKFQEAVELFNQGQFYGCHDVLEEMWHQSAEPQRGVLHGLLQCAVGMHHLLTHNHQGAMMEFGEGLNKLRRCTSSLDLQAPTNGAGGAHWLVLFEGDASAVLEFIYNTQLEYAACSEEACVTMDGSEESYALLGNYGKGEAMYRVAQAAPFDSGDAFLEFLPPAKGAAPSVSQSVRVPRLDPQLASLDNLAYL